MERDDYWKPLFFPGQATNFFNLGDLPEFLPDKVNYHAGNALFMAELCRWIYNTDNEEARASGSSTSVENAYLDRANLREVRLCNPEEAQASLLLSKDESYAILLYRGTSKLQDWLANLNAPAVRWWGKGMVHKGFMEAFVKIWEQVAPVLADVSVPVFFAGHSLGGALATLTASLRAPHALYTFGSPRVGNRVFAQSLQHVTVHRLVNGLDVVPTLPIPGGPLDYVHVGRRRRLWTHARWNLLRGLAGLRRLWRRRKFSVDTFLQAENPFRPSDFLVDHAPLNYVTRLQREWHRSSARGR